MMSNHWDYKQQYEYYADNFIEFNVFEPIAYGRCNVGTVGVRNERPIHRIIIVCAHFLTLDSFTSI